MSPLTCSGCGHSMVQGDHSRCLGSRPVLPRRTVADKLERVQEIANDMVRDAAGASDRLVMEALARYSERLNRALEGEF